MADPVLIAGGALLAAGAAHEVSAMLANSRAHPEGSGTASGTAPVSLVSSAMVAVATATGGAVLPVLSNAQNLPTQAQKDEWLRRRRVRTPNIQLPRNIVPRVRVPIAPNLDLRPLSHAASLAAGCGPAGGDIIATLVSIETYAGINRNAACWNWNLGNQKGNHLWNTPRPVWFIVDSRRSLDFYPSFSSQTEGLTELVGLLRRVYPGSLAALERGNIRDFNAVLGRVGYADSYARPDFMWARYARLRDNGRLNRNDVRH